MPFPRKLSEAGRAEIEAVAIAESQLPTDKALAAKYGVSRSLIQQIKHAVRVKVRKLTCSPWNQSDTIG